MKYILIDVKNGDMFNEEFNTADEAIAEAERQWDNMSEYDKKQRTDFYVLESINPDEEAENHFDGQVILSKI